jgi:hypothetical protein
MNAPVSITPYGSVATVRVLLPVPDRLNVEKRPFNAVDQDLPIVAVAGRQRRRIDCGERIEGRVQPRGVFSLRAKMPRGPMDICRQTRGGATVSPPCHSRQAWQQTTGVIAVAGAKISAPGSTRNRHDGIEQGS